MHGCHCSRSCQTRDELVQLLRCCLPPLQQAPQPVLLLPLLLVMMPQQQP
jgi:hypothetical protein